MDKETEALFRIIAHDASKKAVHDTLISLGIDPANPLDSQRDFARLREFLDDPDMLEDWTFVRSFRKTVSQAKTKSLMTVVGIITLAIAYGAWSAITGHPPGV